MVEGTLGWPNTSFRGRQALEDLGRTSSTALQPHVGHQKTIMTRAGLVMQKCQLCEFSLRSSFRKHLGHMLLWRASASQSWVIGERDLQFLALQDQKRVSGCHDRVIHPPTSRSDVLYTILDGSRNSGRLSILAHQQVQRDAKHLRGSVLCSREHNLPFVLEILPGDNEESGNRSDCLQNIPIYCGV